MPVGIVCNVSKVTACLANCVQEMQNEVHLLGSLSHPNIMRFMAISLDPPTIVMQVRTPDCTAILIVGPKLCAPTSCDS